MIALIEQHRAELTAVCRRLHVKSLELFGSAAEGTFDPGRSDLDFLVEFLPETSGAIFGGYFDLKESLQRLLGCNVDLLMPQAIRNRLLRESVKKQRKLVYAA